MRGGDGRSGGAGGRVSKRLGALSLRFHGVPHLTNGMLVGRQAQLAWRGHGLAACTKAVSQAFQENFEGMISISRVLAMRVGPLRRLEAAAWDTSWWASLLVLEAGKGLGRL